MGIYAGGVVAGGDDLPGNVEFVSPEGVFGLLLHIDALEDVIVVGEAVDIIFLGHVAAVRPGMALAKQSLQFILGIFLGGFHRFIHIQRDHAPENDVAFGIFGQGDLPPEISRGELVVNVVEGLDAVETELHLVDHVIAAFLSLDVSEMDPRLVQLVHDLLGV